MKNRLKSLRAPDILFPVVINFDSGGSTFLQRDSPSPPPWRLRPNLFFIGSGFQGGRSRREKAKAPVGTDLANIQVHTFGLVMVGGGRDGVTFRPSHFFYPAA